MVHEIAPERTAVVLIGSEAEHFDPGDPSHSAKMVALLPRLKPFLESARESGMRVVHVVSALRGDGSDTSRPTSTWCCVRTPSTRSSSAAR